MNGRFKFCLNMSWISNFEEKTFCITITEKIKYVLWEINSTNYKLIILTSKNKENKSKESNFITIRWFISAILHFFKEQI